MCPWPGPSFAEAGKPFGALITAETLTGLDADDWELYRVAEDPAENNNLATQHRDKLIELIAMWYAEAGKYDVFPIDASAAERLMTERPQVAEPRAQYVFRPHTQTLSFWVGPHVLNRPHSITADAEVPDGGAEGVLICQGSNAGGWTSTSRQPAALRPQRRRPRDLPHISAGAAPGRPASAPLRVRPTGKPDFPQGKGAPGLDQLYVDGQLVANAEFPVTTPIASTPASSPAAPTPGPRSPGTTGPRSHTGTLHTVTVDLSGDLIADTERDAVAISRQ